MELNALAQPMEVLHPRNVSGVALLPLGERGQKCPQLHVNALGELIAVEVDGRLHGSDGVVGGSAAESGGGSQISTQWLPLSAITKR